MILAVCLNPAVDVTYSVTALRHGTSHPVSAVHRRAGGKGVNAARVLAQLGEAVTLCGFAGGGTGRWLRDELSGSGVTERLTGVAGDTRQSVAVVDDADATVFNEPGPVVADGDWDRLADTFAQQLAGCAAAVMSGSVPPGAPADAYASLVRIARAHGVPTVVDTSGAHLRAAADAGATVLAPNRDEVGLPSGGRAELLAAAAELSGRGGGTAVVSAGRDGLVAVSGEHRWAARPPRQVTGNPTGAGDALSAGLARGLAREATWPLVLADALALAAAAVAAPVAGTVDLDLYRELADLSTVEDVPCP
ncbi:1-phosphofructokinase family hexose kinase [Rugosimonospora africana]|uniref:Sugar kinase n=1 Tax=Rugosimonospora africana TaxID=556532 RepID=A0A8J3QSB3_9ACTN|nr:hexose kinase [Rugosimonospora africana]GIH16590.1 sugar kinase [Rugosimonospora africana]